MVDGTHFMDQLVKNNHIARYYEHILSNQKSWRPKIDGVTFSILDQQCAEWHERSFEEDDVWKESNSCYG